ncbi:substrate-binding domain-containing protein [Sorangium sp. So ce1153]|uniref:substrate-binding domain-containing protein n=1 Tax=Sorangium sp. So ce1153 TaxID=3133333 RepID=UPI003F60FAF2
MDSGLDVVATLHHLVEGAVALLPGARRGSLLTRAGQRLVYGAAVGFDGVLPAGARALHDAGALSASDPIGPAAAPEAARGPCVVPAAAWYRAHLPAVGGAPGWLPEGASMYIAPVHLYGAPSAYLALEQPAHAAPLSDERRALLDRLVERAGFVLERHGLFDEKAQTARELRLLEDVLGAVAEAVDPIALIRTVGDGIRSVQLGPQWTRIDLVIQEDPGHGARAADADLTLRVYEAPRRPMTGYWNNVRDGVLAAGRDLGVHVEFKTGRTSGPAAQASLIEEAVREGVKAIAVAPIDAEALEPAIQRAAAAGIPVVAIDSPPAKGSRAMLYIGTDNAAAGSIAGEMMACLLPQGGRVATQTSSMAALNSRLRLEGFHAGVAGASLRVDPPTEDLYDVERAIRLAAATLEANPDIAGAFGVCSENGPSFGLAAKRLGRGGDLKVIAFDLVASTYAMLRDGVIHAAIVQREHDMGYQAVQVLCETIARGVEAVLSEMPASRCVDTGVDVVTLERTERSIALADYLAMSSARKIASRSPDEPSPDHGHRILVIGMAENVHPVQERQIRVGRDSLVGWIMRSACPRVVNPDSSEREAFREVADARELGTRTLACVPLRSRAGVLGALVLHSEREDACTAGDLALLERVASVAAVVIENARLLSRIKERTRELEALSRRQEALLDTIAVMSSPVVPIAPGVLVMPIVGALDAQRSGRFIEALLKEISEHQARVVIVDVTGMAVIDASAASHLAQAARAAGLLGSEVVLVGIAPEAARLMVEQGLELGSIVTRSTLELGFSYALGKTGGRVVYQRG